MKKKIFLKGRTHRVFPSRVVIAFSLLNFTLFFFENLWEKEACSVINRAESLCLEKYLLMLFFLSSLDPSFFPFFLLPPFPPQPVGKCCSSSSSSPPLRHLRFPTHKRDKKSFFFLLLHRRPPREGRGGALSQNCRSRGGGSRAGP